MLLPLPLPLPLPLTLTLTLTLTLPLLRYNSLNMQKHAPKPFYLYIANRLNSTAGMNVVHNAVHTRAYV